MSKASEFMLAHDSYLAAARPELKTPRCKFYVTDEGKLGVDGFELELDYFPALQQWVKDTFDV